MKVNEIEINGKIYRACYSDKNHINICNDCDLKSQCDTDVNEIIREICSNNFACNFKEVKQKEDIHTKLYRFSTGTVFHVNHIKDIIDMSCVELCIEDPTKYGFTILMTNGVVIFVRFDTKLIATRERNKFIKFIEEYGN